MDIENNEIELTFINTYIYIQLNFENTYHSDSIEKGNILIYGLGASDYSHKNKLFQPLSPPKNLYDKNYTKLNKNLTHSLHTIKSVICKKLFKIYHRLK